MIWDKLHQAVEELYPGARVGFDWNMNAQKEMFLWNEAKLGPVDVAAIEARTYEIEARPPPPPPLRPDLYKTDIIERMDDAELDAFNAGMQAAPLRQRMMWENCVTVVHGTPYWDALYAAFAAAFGETRASEIMSRG